jgi:hypothetical protein
VRTRSPFRKNALASLHARFFLYDRATEQIIVIGCCAGQLPHKQAAVN